MCETEPHSLFRATPIPIVTNNSLLIANIENDYFIVNEKKTELTEMTNVEVENGISLSKNDVLYKVRILTEVNPKINCIWSQFLNNDINELKLTCKLSPIPKSNYITTINENDLYHITVTKPMIFWETCEHIERKYHVNKTGFLQTKPKCIIKTDDYIIKTHDNIKLNFTSNIQPFLYGGSFSINDFDNITNELPVLKEEVNTKVINSKSNIQTLKEETMKLIKLADHKVNLKKLEHESSWFSLSISLPGILTMGMIIILAISCACMYYCKIPIFKCWYNSIRKKEKPKQFQLKSVLYRSKRKYRKTPYVIRKNTETGIEVEDESDSEDIME